MVTEAQVQNQINAAIKIFDQDRLQAAVNAGINNQNGTSLTNWIALENSFVALMTGDYTSDMIAALRAARSARAKVLTVADTAITPGLRMYGQFLNVPEQAAPDLLTRVYLDQVTNNKAIMSRGFTFGTIASGSPLVGNGTIYRLTTDEYGFTLENCTADTKTFQCIADANSGARGRNAEIFEARGAAANRDFMAISGSGVKRTITVLSADASLTYLRNPSFSSLSGTASVPTDIASWTSSVTVNATNYQFITDTYANQGVGYYRDYPGDTTPYALQCLSTTFTLSQSLEQQRAAFAAAGPMFVQVAYKKSTVGTDGTLTMTLGGVSTNVSLGGVGDTNWHVLQIPLGINCWFRQFNAANLTFSLARSGGSTGNVTLDDVVLAPFTPFDGTYWAIVGGTTNFKRLDTLSAADTELGETYALIQKWMWRAYGRYLAALPKAPTTDCAVALAGAGAGNVDNGAHSYTTTFVDVNGIESGFASAAHNAVTVADKTVNGKVTVSSIPTGPATTAKRKVYRSKAGTTTPFFLLTTIADNATTTYTDNTADASLGAQAATQQVNGITWADPV